MIQVGLRTTGDGGVDAREIKMQGIAKDNVLPLPVCAQAIKSRPASATGMACACTGLGSVIPLPLRLSSTDFGRFNDENDVIGSKWVSGAGVSSRVEGGSSGLEGASELEGGSSRLEGSPLPLESNSG